jgi:hypothetical protein
MSNGRRHLKNLIIIACVVLGVCSSCGAIVAYTGFAGIVIGGEHAYVGDVTSGVEFNHTLKIYNLFMRPVTVTINPTCGCAFDGPIVARIKPLSWRTISVRYRVTSTAAAPVRTTRKLIIAYCYDHSQTRMTLADVTFTLHSAAANLRQIKTAS